jgi:hypothetical protein
MASRIVLSVGFHFDNRRAQNFPEGKVRTS